MSVINFDRVISKGKWIEGELGGQQWRVRNVRVTNLFPDLKGVPEEKLVKRTKASLKKAGFQKVHATKRWHPFHDPSFRRRIDECAKRNGSFEPLYCMEEYLEAVRKRDNADIDKAAALYARRGKDYDVEAERRRAHEQSASVSRRAARAWAKSVNDYRSMLRDDTYWRGTSRYFTMFYEAKYDPVLPPSAYVNKQHPGFVILIRDNGYSLDIFFKMSDPPNKPKAQFEEGSSDRRLAYLDAPFPQPETLVFTN